MTPMLEKIARAIGERGGSTEYGPIIPESLLPDLARAALLAMREPDNRMMDSGCDVGPDTNSGCFSYDNAESVFTAMIDAILKEGGE